MAERPSIADLVALPGPFQFRVLADHHDELVDRCHAIVVATIGRPPTHVDSKPSFGGKYRAVRLTVHIEAANEIEATYAALKAMEGVRYLL